MARRPATLVEGKSSAAAGFPNGSGERWLVWSRGLPAQPVTVQLASATAAASSFAAVSLCGLPKTELRVDAGGRSATLRLAPQAVHVIDVPAGAALKVEELNG